MGESPFSRNPDEFIHADVGWLSRQGFGHLAYAYREAADALCAAVEESGRSEEAMYITASFCYRHSIELYLKAVIRLIEAHSGEQAPHRFRGSHHLLDMWDWISDRLCDLGFNALPADERAVIEAFEEVDQNGTAFRYNLDMQNNPQLARLPPTVSISNLHNAATRAIDLLDSLEEYLAEAPE